MDHRPRKETDNENIDKALKILEEVVDLNPQIEMSLWYGAFWSAIVQGYINSGHSYDFFKRESREAIDFYKRWFEHG